MKHQLAAVALLLALVAPGLVAAERVDHDAVARLRHEGLRNSQVMDLASTLLDRYGPRVTGSPEIVAASRWAEEKLREWGLTAVALEPWEAPGRGWSWESASVRMVHPTTAQFYAVPKAFSPGTDGALRAKVVRVDIEKEEDLEKHRGKVNGRIVLVGAEPELAPHATPALKRHDEASLEKLAAYEIAGRSRWTRERILERRALQRAIAEFMRSEGALAVLQPGSGGDGGTFDVSATGAYRKGEPIGVPELVLAAEHYGRIARLVAAGEDVELEVDLRATIDENQPLAWNIVGEIPGTDRKDEVVIIGAHFDSWHAGTGATDNGAGVVAMMEAMRLLKATGLKPRRTIRIALWSGEEIGLLGSRAYVGEHFAAWPQPDDPEERLIPAVLRKEKGELQIKPGHRKLAAYFNLDNGTGKIRGIYAQENLKVVPIFEAWIAPLRDLGVTTVTMRNTTGTDHLSFDEVGLPGFQFIQDDVEYSARTHHSTADTYERLQREDLMQAAVVIATFAYHAAIREEMLPRKPIEWLK